jgi:hypothetical protein
MKKYIAAKDIAKLVRQDLKANFPEVKFSVRSGSCIRVSYNAEIPARKVLELISKYEGEGFDGQQDLRYSKGAFAIEDGVELVSLASFVFVDNDNYEFENWYRSQPIQVGKWILKPIVKENN